MSVIVCEYWIEFGQLCTCRLRWIFDTILWFFGRKPKMELCGDMRTNCKIHCEVPHPGVCVSRFLCIKLQLRLYIQSYKSSSFLDYSLLNYLKIAKMKIKTDRRCLLDIHSFQKNSLKFVDETKFVRKKLIFWILWNSSKREFQLIEYTWGSFILIFWFACFVIA